MGKASDVQAVGFASCSADCVRLCGIPLLTKHPSANLDLGAALFQKGASVHREVSAITLHATANILLHDLTRFIASHPIYHPDLPSTRISLSLASSFLLKRTLVFPVVRLCFEKSKAGWKSNSLLMRPQSQPSSQHPAQFPHRC
jgi:hypothetical protein